MTDFVTFPVRGRTISLHKMTDEMVLQRWNRIQVLSAQAKVDENKITDVEEGLHTLALLVLAGEALVEMAVPGAPLEWVKSLTEPDKALIINTQDGLNGLPQLKNHPGHIKQVQQYLAYAARR